uniref:Uncharacterized protein n=1 Tax=Pristionchus pacificus TaxID=54126 RepID=A0A2A6B4X2_PRIPA|eukprot:PDM60908.1 hypothetical protein PRIPAC_54714 [Pristionchus pacificus]
MATFCPECLISSSDQLFLETPPGLLIDWIRRNKDQLGIYTPHLHPLRVVHQCGEDDDAENEEEDLRVRPKRSKIKNRTKEFESLKIQKNTYMSEDPVRIGGRSLHGGILYEIEHIVMLGKTVNTPV